MSYTTVNIKDNDTVNIKKNFSRLYPEDSYIDIEINDIVSILIDKNKAVKIAKEILRQVGDV
jgi:hypothetical protein